VFYFSPCRTFVDLLEFRFGFCWDQFQLARTEGNPEIFHRCIRETFSNQHVQQRINETVISCWSYNPESPYMWEVYGGSKAAIIVTADEDELLTFIKKKWGDDATAGPVRYDSNSTNAVSFSSLTMSRAGWSWGCVSAADYRGRTTFVADAHRGDGRRFVLRANEKLTAFGELESAVRARGELV
jgi:hypothetical protein